jgi:hypothetical protein
VGGISGVLMPGQAPCGGGAPLGHHAGAWRQRSGSCVKEGRYAESNARFLRALAIARNFGDTTLLSHLLEGFSGLATARSQHQRAVRLGGAAAALRETAGAPLGPAWQHIPDRWLAISREALGEVAAAAAWSAGRSLPVERALEEARDSVDVTTIGLTS